MSGHRRAGRAIGAPLRIAAAIVAVDQATKWLVGRWLGPGRDEQRFEVLGAALAFEYLENSGAALGVLRGQGMVLGLLALVVLGGLVTYYRRLAAPSREAMLGVGLIVGGAVGNLVDRVRLGHVVDFVAVGVWPKFNLADSAITIGVAVLAWHLLTSDQPSAISDQPAGDGVGTSRSDGMDAAGRSGDRLTVER